jgi:hypothetical protein
MKGLVVLAVVCQTMANDDDDCSTAAAARFRVVNTDPDSITVEEISTTATHTMAAGWLRERCLSIDSVQGETNQPKHGYHTHAAGALKVQHAAFVDAGTGHGEQTPLLLAVVFGDGHKSRFIVDSVLAELADTAHSFIQPAEFFHLPKQFWHSSLADPPSFEWDDLALEVGTKLQVAKELLAKGIVIVKHVPAQPGQVVQLADLLHGACVLVTEIWCGERGD